MVAVGTRLQRARNLVQHRSDVQRTSRGEHLDMMTAAGQTEHQAVKGQFYTTAGTAAERSDRGRHDQDPL
jgi:hypothetical protein